MRGGGRQTRGDDKAQQAWLKGQSTTVCRAAEEATAPPAGRFLMINCADRAIGGLQTSLSDEQEVLFSTQHEI